MTAVRGGKRTNSKGRKTRLKTKREWRTDRVDRTCVSRIEKPRVLGFWGTFPCFVAGLCWGMDTTEVKRYSLVCFVPAASAPLWYNAAPSSTRHMKTFRRGKQTDHVPQGERLGGVGSRARVIYGISLYCLLLLFSFFHALTAIARFKLYSSSCKHLTFCPRSILFLVWRARKVLIFHVDIFRAKLGAISRLNLLYVQSWHVENREKISTSDTRE